MISALPGPQRTRSGFRGNPVDQRDLEQPKERCHRGLARLRRPEEPRIEAIRRRECEAALVVGTDASVNRESLIRFSLLSALSTRNDPPASAARPFSARVRERASESEEERSGSAEEGSASK